MKLRSDRTEHDSKSEREHKTNKRIDKDENSNQVTNHQKREGGEQKPNRNKYTSYSDYRQNYDPKRETRTCNICGEPGHIAPYCPKRTSKPANQNANPDPSTKDGNSTTQNKADQPKSDVPKFEKKAHAWFTSSYTENELELLDQDEQNMKYVEEDDELTEFRIQLDGGADRHMVNELHRLHTVVVLKKPIIIDCANQTVPSLLATHSGDLKLEIKSRHGTFTEIVLKDVLYVPNLARHLISAELIVESERYRIDYRSQWADIIESETNEVVCTAFTDNRAKYFTVRQRFSESEGTARALVTISNSGESERMKSAVLMHRRTGHASAKTLQRLSTCTKDWPPNLKIKQDDLKDCDVCRQAKSTKLPHNTERTRSVRLLESLSSDIMGPLITSETEDRYIITFIDSYSNFAVIFIIKNRAEAATCFAEYHKNAMARFPELPIVQLHTDQALEYVQGNLKRYCEAAGISTEQGQPYCPELNGKAERFNRTLTEKMRCLFFDSKVPTSKWPEVAKAAVHLINRLPTKSIPNYVTPYELWHSSKPTIKYLRVFGCIAYQHIPKEVRHRVHNDQKFEIRSWKLIHMGISGSTGYILFDPEISILIQGMWFSSKIKTT